MTSKYECSSPPRTNVGNPCPGRHSRDGEDQTDDQLQEKVYEQFSSRASTGCSGFPASSSVITKDDEAGDSSDGSGAALCWMPSKMRIMRKMMNSGAINDPQRWIRDDTDNSSNHAVPAGNVRVCSDCKTTKTPLWRSGPQGPKSLCNACGIRQRKARRAMMAASLIPAAEKTKARNQKIVHSECAVPLKKRCKFTSAEPRKKLHFEEFAMSLTSSPAFHGVFPQEEKDAAVLLMGLSYGLIRS